MFELHLRDTKPIPNLAVLIAKQKHVGGRLILYRCAWSALAITVTQSRVEHVGPHDSRVLAGWRHDLFTVIFGIWSPMGLVTMPLYLILNLRGGMDVTAYYSDSPTDKLRGLPPDPNQARRDALIAQWTFVVLGLATIGAVFYCLCDSPFPK
jgi:hypothetical protein